MGKAPMGQCPSWNLQATSLYLQKWEKHRLEKYLCARLRKSITLLDERTTYVFAMSIGDPG